MRRDIINTAGFVVFFVAMQIWFDFFVFDRSEIFSGEVWRIWTGHLVHANNEHFFLNVFVSIIVYFLFFSKFSILDLLFSGFVFAPLISLVMLAFYPNVEWYSGLSGLLHGIAAFFILRMPEYNQRIFWLGLAFLWGKVLLELIFSYFGYESSVGGVAVLSDAHLIGLTFGTLAGMMFKVRQKIVNFKE